MATGLDCPSCQKHFVAERTAGEVRCPHCAHHFTVECTQGAPRMGILVSAPPSSAAATKLPAWMSEAAPPAPPPGSPVSEPTTPAAHSGSHGVPQPAGGYPAVSPAPETPVVVGASGRRLTTLVRDAVEAVVSRSPAKVRQGVVELSVIGLTLGLTALAITWPFRLAGVGLLLGGAGLVLGGTAVVLVLRRKAGDFLLPGLASLISGQAVVMALCLTGMAPAAPQVVHKERAFPDLGDLQAALVSEDAAVRAHALTTIGKLAGHVETTRASLLGALEDGDETVRTAAVEVLGQIGPPARVAYPVLMKAAQLDPSDKVRHQALLALKKVGAPTHADLGDFLVLLKDASPRLRSASALAMGQLGPEARDAAPLLEKVLGDADMGVRVSAAQALWEIMKEQAKGVVPVLIGGLQDPTNAVVRARAAAALGLARTRDDKAIASLEHALHDGDGNVRIEAAFSLGLIGSVKSVPEFNLSLTDPEVKVRIVAAQALWILAKQTQGVPVLIQALGHLDPDIRVNAVAALGKFGPEARKAVPMLSLALKDLDDGVSARAAEALYNIGPEAREAVPALRHALEHSDPRRRAQAAFALGGLGAAASDALPELRAALKDRDAAVQLFAARALWPLDPKLDVVPVMTKILRGHKDPDQRARAAALLGALGRRAGNAAPDLLEGLHDPDNAVRAAAARALGDIGGPTARITYPALVELTKEEQPDDNLRQAAAESLKKIGRPTKADVDPLILALEHREARYRAGAAVCLWLMNRDAKKAVPFLSKKLGDDNETVRTSVAFALAAIGPDAAAAVPDLIAVLQNMDDEVQRARAAYTLGEIGPPAKEAAKVLRQVALDDKDKASTRFQAARALWTISQQTAEMLPVYNKALEDDDDELNLQAAELLAKVAGSLAAAPADRATLKDKTVPLLVTLLKDSTESVPTAAAAALGALGALAQTAVPHLLQALEEEETETRAMVAEALGKIGAAEAQANNREVWARTATSALFFFSRMDQSDKVRRLANGALSKIGTPGAGDADFLLRLLDDKSQAPAFRNALAQVLGMINKQLGKKDIPRLGALLKEGEDTVVQATIAYTLGEIGPDAKSEVPALVRSLKSQDPALTAAAAFALGEILENQRAPAVEAALRETAEAADENVAAAARAALKKISAK